MRYAIWDTAVNKVTRGPWTGSLPGRIKWASGDTTSPPALGMTNGTEIICEMVTVGKPLGDAWNDVTSEDTFDGSQTVTRTFTKVRTRNPSAFNVHQEAENRIDLRLSRGQQIEWLFDYLQLKEIKDDGGTLTQAQQNRWDNIRALWQYVRQVRQAAKTIAQLDPVPDDYDDDARWPQ